MLIRLKLHAVVADEIGDMHDAEVVQGTTVEELLAALHVDKQRAGFVLVNGQRVPYNTQLREGDTVFVMPFLGGG